MVCILELQKDMYDCVLEDKHGQRICEPSCFGKGAAVWGPSEHSIQAIQTKHNVAFS